MIKKAASGFLWVVTVPLHIWHTFLHPMEVIVDIDRFRCRLVSHLPPERSGYKVGERDSNYLCARCCEFVDIPSGALSDYPSKEQA